MAVFSTACALAIIGTLAADFFISEQHSKQLWLLLGLAPAAPRSRGPPSLGRIPRGTPERSGVRLAIYTDYAYHQRKGRIYAERAFALFLAELATRIDRTVVIGRLSPEPSKARYDLGDVDFVPLPFYRSLAEPLSALRAIAGSLRSLWEASTTSTQSG